MGLVAGRVTASTHTNWCSSRVLLAHSISTFLLVASTRTDSIMSCGKSLDVLCSSQIKISFQICAGDAIHSHSSGLPANPLASGYDPLPLFEDVLLGAEPVLFFLSRFTTTALI